MFADFLIFERHIKIFLFLRFIWLLEVLQELYTLNFRVISHEVNMVMGPGEGGLYNLVEVVFMKDNIWNHQGGLQI